MRYIAIIAAWKSASLAWIQHSQSINLSNSLSNMTRHGYLAATGMRSAVTVCSEHHSNMGPRNCVEWRKGAVPAEGKARHDSSWGKFLGHDVALPALSRQLAAPYFVLRSKPPLRPIYGGKWNTTVLCCRQRRRRCTERRGGNRQQVVWRRYGIDRNCYHYASYCFKYFCSLAVRLSQRTVVTFWRPTLRKIVHVIQNSLDHMTQLISFRAEESLG